MFWQSQNKNKESSPTHHPDIIKQFASSINLNCSCLVWWEDLLGR